MDRLAVEVRYRMGPGPFCICGREHHTTLVAVVRCGMAHLSSDEPERVDGVPLGPGELLTVLAIRWKPELWNPKELED